jgi:hypothetical protein
MSNRRESIERIIDNNYLKAYKNTPFEDSFKKLLKAYKKIFFVVYDSFESRFQRIIESKYIFEQMFFLSLYKGFIDLIKKPIENRKEELNKLYIENTLNEKEDLKIKVVLFFETENQNEPEKLNKVELYIDAEEIFNEIRFKIFDQAESWLTIIEFDKIVVKQTNKDKEKKINSLLDYIKENKDRFSIKYVNPVSNISEDFKPLYSLLNADRKKDFFESMKKPFNAKKEDQASSYNSESKSLTNFFNRYKEYLKGKIEFEQRMINQLKQLTNL